MNTLMLWALTLIAAISLPSLTFSIVSYVMIIREQRRERKEQLRLLLEAKEHLQAVADAKRVARMKRNMDLMKSNR